MRSALHRLASLHQCAAFEALRMARTGKGFSLLRIAPVGWAALDEEMEALEVVVQAQVRQTDFVQRVREREVGVVLVEAIGEDAAVALARVRLAVKTQLPKLDVRTGWASVGPGQRKSWQEAWRWAGHMLVGDAARAAA